MSKEAVSLHTVPPENGYGEGELQRAKDNDCGGGRVAAWVLSSSSPSQDVLKRTFVHAFASQVPLILRGGSFGRIEIQHCRKTRRC